MGKRAWVVTDPNGDSFGVIIAKDEEEARRILPLIEDKYSDAEWEIEEVNLYEMVKGKIYEDGKLM